MKKFLATVLVFASTGICGVRNASAVDEVPSPRPTEILRARHDPAITSGYAWVWDLDAPGAVPYYAAHVDIPQTPPLPSWPDPRVLCTGPTDSNCNPGLYSRMTASNVLGVCESDSEIGCIESFSSRSTSGGEFVPLTKIAGGDTVHSESTAFNLPRSATLSTWQDTTGARYVLTAHMMTSLTSSGGAWSAPTSSSLILMVTRVSRTTTQPAGIATIIDSPSMPGKKAVSMAYGVVSNAVEMSSNLRFNVKVRVPNTVAGWFQGRIANAVVGSKALSGSRTVYEIEGDVSPVYVAGGEASSSDPLYPMKNSGTTGFLNALSSPSSIQDYERWKPFLGDKALVTRNEWALTALSVSTNSCFEASKGLTGIASSNAAFYSPTPPVYNLSTGAVEYKVASPHYDENGAVAVGSYSLSIPTAAVQCLYKTDKVPEAAELSTTYDDGSSTYTVTKSLTNKDGWINVSVAGLHFSSPTISAKFGMMSSGSSGFSALSASTSASSSTSIAVPSRNSVRTTVSGSRAVVNVTLTAKGTVSVYRKVGSRLTLIKRFAAKKGTNKVTTTYRKGYSFVVKDAKGRTIAKAG